MNLKKIVNYSYKENICYIFFVKFLANCKMNFDGLSINCYKNFLNIADYDRLCKNLCKQQNVEEITN